MRIGIDARMYGSKQGGIGRYIEQIIKYFEQLSNDSSTEFVIFLNKDNWDDFNPQNSRFTKVLANIKWYGWREQIQFPKIIKKSKIDLMHFPHWNIPLFYSNPFVVTIHDLLLFHYPTKEASTLGPISYFLKNIAYHMVLKHALNKSKYILTPSKYTKEDIIKLFKINCEKITVTYLAPTKITSTADTDMEKKLKYSPNKPYVLYIGVAYPHKNLDRLIDAWKIFYTKYGNKYNLVLAGRNNYFYKKLINKVAIEKIENIVFTDYVQDKDLELLYKNASLYVFPSLYEGFGLPPLEAMHYEIPVISSNATCLPEILNDAALYFNPKNISDIVDTIWQGLTDADLRQTLNTKSRQLIHNYSWKQTAKQTLEVYDNMV